MLHGYENEKPVKEIGSVIVFPSYLSHRVNRVTTGERWSLVARASVSLAEVSTLGKTGSETVFAWPVEVEMLSDPVSVQQILKFWTTVFDSGDRSTD